MIELTFLKRLMLVRQAHPKSVAFFTIGMFLYNGFKFQPRVCNGCQDVLMLSMNLSKIAILNIHGIDCCCLAKVKL